MIKKIGFAGLGIMGLPVALNLIRAGFEVQAWSRSRKNYSTVEEAGALTAESPAAAAAGADVLVLMLTGPEAVDAVLFGSSDVRGGCEEANPGMIVVNMSTVPPEYSRDLAARLKERRIILVDAPVSGSRKPAEEGSLVILAGGPEETVKELEPVFSAVGKKTVYCGNTGQGSAMKLSVNMLLGTMQAALGESLNFAEKSGIETEKFLDTVLNGPLGCDLFRMKKQMLIEDSYPPQFPLKHMVKDLGFALDAVKKLDIMVPLGVQAFACYAMAQKEQLGEEDFSAVKRVIWKKGR